MNVPRWLMTVAVLMSLSIGRALAGEPATAVATITAGFVTGITVTSGGSGYTSEPAVTVTGGGGSGASGKAILAGDKVSLILVLTAGNGYTGSPTVVVEAPPKPLGVKLEMVPKLTVEGPVGGLARVESAASLSGPWTMWTNVVVGADGVVLVDLSSTANQRFYRATTQPIDFVWVEPGSFRMGSPLNEAGRNPGNEAQRTVILTKGFWICDHEVTQKEFQSIMGLNPSLHIGQNRPVHRVSWNDAVEYCNRLTEIERKIRRISNTQNYRLPTEAEWEYAARATTLGSRHGDLNDIAWYIENSGGKPQDIRTKQPNKWAIYDMIGNVWEWCSDWGDSKTPGVFTDPKGPETGQDKVFRGGGSISGPSNCRSAVAGSGKPSEGYFEIGFRVVISEIP